MGQVLEGILPFLGPLTDDFEDLSAKALQNAAISAETGIRGFFVHRIGGYD